MTSRADGRPRLPDGGPRRIRILRHWTLALIPAAVLAMTALAWGCQEARWERDEARSEARRAGELRVSAERELRTARMAKTAADGELVQALARAAVAAQIAHHTAGTAAADRHRAKRALNRAERLAVRLRDMDVRRAAAEAQLAVAATELTAGRHARASLKRRLAHVRGRLAGAERARDAAIEALAEAAREHRCRRDGASAAAHRRGGKT
jgi:hypothetical protein